MPKPAFLQNGKCFHIATGVYVDTHRPSKGWTHSWL